jgi:hypothetical protein
MPLKHCLTPLTKHCLPYSLHAQLHLHQLNRREVPPTPARHHVDDALQDVVKGQGVTLTSEILEILTSLFSYQQPD